MAQRISSGIEGFRERAENLSCLNAFLDRIGDRSERKRFIVLITMENFIAVEAAELLIEHHGLFDA